MKPPLFICLIFIFLGFNAASQDRTTPVFHLGEIPASGLVLDSGWIYKAGDDPARARPDHNDSDGWIRVNAAEELHHMTPEVRKAGMGWFRLNLQVDSSLFNRTVAFVISGLGASEIYLNGELLYTFGKVSSNFSEEKTRFYTNRLLSLKFNGRSKQVLAIRYSFHKKNLYLKFAVERPVAKIVLKKIDQAFADHIKDDNFDATLRSIQVSFYLPLGFLLLFMFWSFRLQKEYLYSGIFCFCMFAAILMHIFSLSEPTPVTRSNYLLYLTQILYIVGALCLINGSYIIFNRKKSWFYYFIAAYGAFSLLFYFLSYDLSGVFNTIFFPLINIEFLRISWLAFRRKRKGAGIFFITGLVLNVSLLFLIWFTISNQPQLSAFLQSICFIVPGVGLSLFFAGEFARTASALHFRAIEVEQLSHEMITKEKEKQQILGAQNETLEKQVAERTAALSQSLKELKETQQHLFQREKMASLGELTAGIAHEIQNPLNFVNNFSEVNAELIEEMQQEIDNGNLENAKTIAGSIKQNFEKISQHGKRADGIVKGMLQHSRSAGIKEPADINQLVEEYFRLAYHGLRAKDKTFNAVMKMDFDKHIEKMNIAPHDIGRVILNLTTNAFYAATEKKKQAGDDHEPTVSVSTKKNGDKIEIRIKDNGNGIPQKVLDKIFQPFFTTKPTGQGTGLGLSISYDIIKAHDGELYVETIEGEGAAFIISLPG